MTTLLTFLLLLPQAAGPTRGDRPSLIVQLVDTTWAAIPDAEVTVAASAGKKETRTGCTDYNGYVKFWVEGDQECTIEAKTKGFKTKRLKHVYLYKSNEPTSSSLTSYVQLRLKSSERPITVY